MRFIVLAVAALLAVVVFTHLTPDRNLGGAQDAVIRVGMLGNLATFAAIVRDGYGNADLTVRDGVVAVMTSDPNDAAAMCRQVAAVTSEPNGRPLGVVGVTVKAAGTTLVSCRP